MAVGDGVGDRPGAEGGRRAAEGAGGGVEGDTRGQVAGAVGKRVAVGVGGGRRLVGGHRHAGQGRKVGRRRAERRAGIVDGQREVGAGGAAQAIGGDHLDRVAACRQRTHVEARTAPGQARGQRRATGQRGLVAQAVVVGVAEGAGRDLHDRARGRVDRVIGQCPNGGGWRVTVGQGEAAGGAAVLGVGRGDLDLVAGVMLDRAAAHRGDVVVQRGRDAGDRAVGAIDAQADGAQRHPLCGDGAGADVGTAADRVVLIVCGDQHHGGIGQGPAVGFGEGPAGQRQIQRRAADHAGAIGQRAVIHRRRLHIRRYRDDETDLGGGSAAVGSLAGHRVGAHGGWRAADGARGGVEAEAWRQTAGAVGDGVAVGVGGYGELVRGHGHAAHHADVGRHGAEHRRRVGDGHGEGGMGGAAVDVGGGVGHGEAAVGGRRATERASGRIEGHADRHAAGAVGDGIAVGIGGCRCLVGGHRDASGRREVDRGGREHWPGIVHGQREVGAGRAAQTVFGGDGDRVAATGDDAHVQVLPAPAQAAWQCAPAGQCGGIGQALPVGVGEHTGQCDGDRSRFRIGRQVGRCLLYGRRRKVIAQREGTRCGLGLAVGGNDLDLVAGIVLEGSGAHGGNVVVQRGRHPGDRSGGGVDGEAHRAQGDPLRRDGAGADVGATVDGVVLFVRRDQHHGAVGQRAAIGLGEGTAGQGEVDGAAADDAGAIGQRALVDRRRLHVMHHGDGEVRLGRLALRIGSLEVQGEDLVLGAERWCPAEGQRGRVEAHPARQGGIAFDAAAHAVTAGGEGQRVSVGLAEVAGGVAETEGAGGGDALVAYAADVNRRGRRDGEGQRFARAATVGGGGGDLERVAADAAHGRGAREGARARVEAEPGRQSRPAAKGGAVGQGRPVGVRGGGDGEAQRAMHTAGGVGGAAGKYRIHHRHSDAECAADALAIDVGGGDGDGPAAGGSWRTAEGAVGVEVHPAGQRAAVGLLGGEGESEADVVHEVVGGVEAPGLARRGRLAGEAAGRCTTGTGDGRG